MGRAGGGVGGHSGGGHSGGGHSGGGHSPGGGFSGGGRPGSGGFSGPGGRPGGPGGFGGPGGPPPPRHGFWGGYGYGGYRRGCGTGCLTPIIIVIVFIIIIGSSVVSGIGGGVRYALSRLRGNTQQITDDTDYEYYDRYDEGNDSTENSSSREKADTGVAFTDDCVLDELGWVEDTAAVGASLEDFYNATGVQPYVYFKAYDASLTTNSEKEEYAFDWYDENIDNEGTFLFIYFAEEDTDNDIGYMVYVNGYDIDSVMDEEAVEIFWNYVDEYWYSSLSTDDMLTEIFNSTADAIMN